MPKIVYEEMIVRCERTIKSGQNPTCLLGFRRNFAFDELSTFTLQPPCLLEFVMRSNQIHRALSQGINRFEVCQLVSKGVRLTHKTGSRFEDSINDALDYLGTHRPAAELHPAIAQIAVKSMKPAA
jgi:hypothetical protein